MLRCKIIAMRVVLLGTGFAVPSRERVQSGVLVETGGNLILLDCGGGVLGNVAKAGYNATDVTHVFLTHLHLDHNIDLFPLLKARWILEENKAKVYGPEGTKKLIDALFEAYPYLKDRFDLEITELKNGDVVSLGDDRITCASVRHSPESIAYRIESVSFIVYTGDTEPCEGVKTLIGDGIDVLIHECSLFDSYIEGHTSVKSLGVFLKDEPIKKLVLTHFSSEIHGHEEEIVEIIKRYFSGEIVIGEDLLSLDLPP